jgi:hypothetical protein
MSTRGGTKGQVVTHKHIRDELGIEPEFSAIQRVVRLRAHTPLRVVFEPGREFARVDRPSESGGAAEF